MTRTEWMAELRGRITPEHFLDAGHRRLAQAVLGNNTNEVFEPRQLDGDDELTQLAGVLLVEDGGPALTLQGLEGCVQRMETYWRKRRKDELEAEIRRGSLSQSDPGYREYLQLVLVLKGQGLKGED
jgi:hypothetical protein